MTPAFDIRTELDFALHLADLADALTLDPFHSQDFSVDWKENKTEVTELDRATERLIADEIARLRPEHSLLGEEFGAVSAGDGSLTWIIDPIDGTSNYARGNPVWATLIALVDADDETLVSVVSAPALGSRWWAERGGGSFNTRGQLRVSNVRLLADAQVSTTYSPEWDAAGGGEKLLQLQRSAYRARGFGDFWQHMLVAEGSCDAAVDAIGLQPYDTAAVTLIVREAGGTFTDRLGNPSFRNGSAVTSNGHLHKAVLDIIRC